MGKDLKEMPIFIIAGEKKDLFSVQNINSMDLIYIKI